MYVAFLLQGRAASADCEEVQMLVHDFDWYPANINFAFSKTPESPKPHFAGDQWFGTLTNWINDCSRLGLLYGR